MKTRTLITLGTAFFLSSILSAMQPLVSDRPVGTAGKAAFSFSYIQIGEGIEVEFEYGPQLQVLNQNGQQEAAVKMFLTGDMLTILNLQNESQTPVRLKVVTPFLVGITRLSSMSGMAVATNNKAITPGVL